MTDTYAPQHLAPTVPEYVVMCHPGQMATHRPFASVGDARTWINLDHPDCPGEHRIVRAAVLDGQPARGDVCGRDVDHTLSPVEDLPNGGTVYECIGCPAEVVIEADGTYVPVDRDIDGGVQW